MILTLVASLMLLTIIVLVIIIKNGWKSIVSLILMPFLLFNVAFSWHTVNELWGQAKLGMPAGEFTFLHGVSSKPWIYLLVVKEGKVEPTFHKIPWTKKDEEELEKGQRQQKQGKRIKGKQSSQGKSDDTQKMMLYEWNHQSEIPKPEVK
jgi:hypothetical protein